MNDKTTLPTTENQIIWPQPFMTGLVDYPLTEEGKAAAIAAALSAWANIIQGHKQPEHFGLVLAKISRMFDISCTPEDLQKAADQIDWGKIHASNDEASRPKQQS